MIQHIQIDRDTHDAVTQAAHDAGLAYDAMLAYIVAEWATTWRGRQRARKEFIQALEDIAIGVIPGGD